MSALELVERIVRATGKSRVEALLEAILDYLDTNFPRSDDEPAYSSLTQTVPAGSIVTVTWRVRGDWLVKVRHLYADAALDCTYRWTLTGLTVEGNEIQFPRAVEVTKTGLITLVITNNGTIDQDIDILIEGWARRLA